MKIVIGVLGCLVGLASLVVVGCGEHRDRDRVVVVDRQPVHEQVIVVDEAPPPQRVEVIPVRPSPDHVWVSGYWNWDDGHRRHVWVDGRYAVPPRGHREWVRDEWVHENGHYRHEAGHWK